MNKYPRISIQQIENILKLDAHKRYHYFIKKVANWGTAWGLSAEGWVLASDYNQILFPF